jgi:hypothetical protein
MSCVVCGLLLLRNSFLFRHGFTFKEENMKVVRKSFVAPVLAITALLIVFGSPARAALFGATFTGDLYKISTTDASVTFIGDTGLSNLGGMAFAPDGTLYGMTVSLANLWTIDPVTAATVFVGRLSNDPTAEGALTILPDGRAFGTILLNFSDLFAVNLWTGQATYVATISGGFHDINGLAWRSDGMLVGLDRVSSALLAIDPVTGESSVIAAVPEPGGTGGMTTIDGLTGFFAIGTSGTYSLYSIDFYTGAQSLIGTLDISNELGGLAQQDLRKIPASSPIILLLHLLTD